MKKVLNKNYLVVLASLSAILIFLPIIQSASAESVPDWARNTALWYGEGEITEIEFLNAIKFLIENNIIIIDSVPEVISSKTVNVIIPNAGMNNGGYYLPLNALVNKDTKVVWINEDVVTHTIQSQDEDGNVVGLFNSVLLNTGDRFEYTFDEKGIYNYVCSLHPWRVGVVTVQ